MSGNCPRLGENPHTHKAIAAEYMYYDLCGAKSFILEGPGKTCRSIPIKSNLSLVKPANAQAIGKEHCHSYERAHRQVSGDPGYENAYACPCNCPQLYQNASRNSTAHGNESLMEHH
ncbi:hypothetical protein ABEW05_000713 [Botrytis cinerea]